MPKNKTHSGTKKRFRITGSGKVMREQIVITDKGCFGCPSPCGKYSKMKRYNTNVEGPEYETIGMMGSNLGISDIQDVAQANLLADDLGIDTISTGGAIGWAMEMHQRGLLSREEADGLDLEWGNPETILALIEKIISANDLKEAEVILDVEILEIARTNFLKYGWNFFTAAGAGIEAEILDLRSLSPYDWEAISESVAKTSKAIVCYEDPVSWGYGAEIAARIGDRKSACALPRPSAMASAKFAKRTVNHSQSASAVKKPSCRPPLNAAPIA